MIVIGGTYDEYCFEPRWENKFGSGLRACWVLGRLDPGETINYFKSSAILQRNNTYNKWQVKSN